LYEHLTGEVYPELQREYGPSLAGAVDAFREEAKRGYDRRKLALYGLKQRMLLKPTIRLYRGRRTSGLVQALMR
ncbi:MAG: hypothetical protein M3138_09000, partial [Actinomycetota bacterium]|nr:hypothetical protein [Actinomycetota bacterium]